MKPVNASQLLTLEVAPWSRLVTTCVAHMTEHLYVGIITVVLPVMATALGMNMAQAGILVSSRSLAAGLSNLPSGLLADLINRRSLLLGVSLIVLGLSSLLMSFAPNYWVLLAFMVLGAVGAGSFHPQSLTILSTAYRDRRALALGVHDSSGNFGEVIAPLTIGTLLTFIDWRSTLQIWAVPGVAVGLLYALFCSEIGATASSSRASFKRALWHDVITNRAVLALFLISVFRAMGQMSLLAFLPLYLTLDLKLPVGAMGFYISLLFFFGGIAPSLSGYFSDRIGRAPLMIWGSALSAAAIAVLPSLSQGIALGLGCAAVGTLLWALRPVIFAAAMEAAPAEMGGSLVGFIYTGNMGLSFIAPIVAGFIADAYGLAAALSLIGVFPLLACFVALSSLRRSAST
ncbi:MAG: MFS transporter [Deltaproteobacteria bacterium]|nr:MFS transporter [Deltaproteobacteria bacterium]